MRMNLFLRTTLALAIVAGLGLAAPAFAQQATTPTTTPATVPAATPAATTADDLDIADDVAPAADAVSPAPADSAGTTAPAAASDAEPRPAHAAMNPAPADPSLLPVYKDFGELPGLTALMDDFMVGLLADARMRPFFKDADQKAIKAHLVEQFCVILGGPCSYTGRDMVAAHAGLEINRSNFNALVEVLQVAMNKRQIPFRSQNKLLAKLAPMHREIETR
jgi:hemoglobin